MKFSTETKPQNHSDTQMIPLINVVFLMLAFFMIAGQIQKSDNVQLDTPISLSDTERERVNTTVSIDMEERIFVNGVATTPNELVEKIHSIRPNEAGISSQSILVRADARLPAQKTREILKILREAGLEKVALATLQTVSANE